MAMRVRRVARLTATSRRVAWLRQPSRPALPGAFRGCLSHVRLADHGKLARRQEGALQRHVPYARAYVFHLSAYETHRGKRDEVAWAKRGSQSSRPFAP